jgi:DNA polymerase
MVHDGNRVGLAYNGTKGVEHIYGGKIVENVIQAMCRDLLADAMVRCERAGLPIVLHVHDELVCEAPGAGRDAYAALHEIMTTLPEWAEGFPIKADGYGGARRYRK